VPKGDEVCSWRPAESATADWISAVCLSPSLLIVARCSGLLQVFSLKDVRLTGTGKIFHTFILLFPI
jgi:hypothetical protein